MGRSGLVRDDVSSSRDWEWFCDARSEGGQSQPESASEEKGAGEEDGGHLECGMEDECSRGRGGCGAVGGVGVSAERRAVGVVDGVEGVHGVVGVEHVGKMAISGTWATRQTRPHTALLLDVAALICRHAPEHGERTRDARRGARWADSARGCGDGDEATAEGGGGGGRG